MYPAMPRRMFSRDRRQIENFVFLVHENQERIDVLAFFSGLCLAGSLWFYNTRLYRSGMFLPVQRWLAYLHNMAL